MTRNEQVALAWARKYLRAHHCKECGREWITAASTTTLMHRCRPPRRGIASYVGVEERNAEQRAAWARRQLGFTEALEDAVVDRDGPDALLRPIDEEI